MGLLLHNKINQRGDEVTHMAEHKPIPQGWRFYSADFSVEGQRGHAMLRRDKAGKDWWHSLGDSGHANVNLYLSGQGDSINEAIDEAISFIPAQAKAD